MSGTWAEGAQKPKAELTDLFDIVMWVERAGNAEGIWIRNERERQIKEKQLPEAEHKEAMHQLNYNLGNISRSLRGYLRSRVLEPFLSDEVDKEAWNKKTQMSRYILIKQMESELGMEVNRDGSEVERTTSEHPVVQKILRNLDALVDKYMPPHKKIHGREDV